MPPSPPSIAWASSGPAWHLTCPCLVHFYHKLPLVVFVTSIFFARHHQNFLHGMSNTANTRKVLRLQKRTYQTVYVLHNNTEYVRRQHKQRPSTACDTPTELTKARTKAQHKQMHPASSQPREYSHGHGPNPIPATEVLPHMSSSSESETGFSHMSSNSMSHPPKKPYVANGKNNTIYGFSSPFLASSFNSACTSGSLSGSKQKPEQGSKKLLGCH